MSKKKNMIDISIYRSLTNLYPNGLITDLCKPELRFLISFLFEESPFCSSLIKKNCFYDMINKQLRLDVECRMNRECKHAKMTINRTIIFMNVNARCCCSLY